MSRPVTPRGLLAAVLASAAMAVLASWPLLPLAGTHFPSAPEMPDLQTAIWLPHNTLGQLSQLDPPTRAPDVAYPHGQSLSTVIWNFGVLLLQAPLYAATHAVHAYNLSLLLLSALNGLGGFVLGRIVGRSRSAGLAAAAALVFNPYVWGELAQGRCEQGLLLWVALALAGAVALWRSPSRRVALLAGAAWGAAGIFYWFYGYFLLLFFLGLGAAALLLRARDRVVAVATSAAVSALLAAPLALPLLVALARPESTYARALAASSAQATAPLPGAFSLGLADLGWWVAPPVQLFAMVPLALLGGLLACALRRETRPLLVLGAGALVLALGPVLVWTAGAPVTLGEGTTLAMPMAALQAWLPGFGRLWWPYRLLALTVVAGAAGLAVLTRRAGRLGPLVAAVLVVLVAAEHRAALARSDAGLLWDDPTPVRVPDFFTELAATPGEQPLFMLPYRGFRYSGLLWVPYHQQPVSSADGYAEDFVFPVDQLAEMRQSPARARLERLARLPPTAALPAPPADAAPVAPALRREGFRYAVLQRVEAHVVARYAALFPAPPVYRDEVVVVWDLEAAPP